MSTSASPQRSRVRVVVIGAGWSGLYTAKKLLEEGIPPDQVVLLEKRDGLGGVWLLDETRRYPSVFRGTSTSSSRVFTQAGDFYMPRERDFPSHREVLSYLHDYAEHFHLEPLLRLGVQVCRVWREEKGSGAETGTEGPSSSLWVVETAGPDPSDAVVYTCDHVMVCTGSNAARYEPSLESVGLSGFTGEVMHAGDYLDPVPFRGKTVLLFGGGETAADLSLEISCVSEAVGLSCPSGLSLIPKAGHFLPFMEKMVPLDSVSSWLRLVVAPTTMNTVYSHLGFFQLQFGRYGHGLTQWLGLDPPDHQTVSTGRRRGGGAKANGKMRRRTMKKAEGEEAGSGSRRTRRSARTTRSNSSSSSSSDSNSTTTTTTTTTPTAPLLPTTTTPRPPASSAAPPSFGGETWPSLVPVWRRFFTKNSELASRVHAGKIRALPGIAKADGRTITFTDGQVMEGVDVVVLCTGFRRDFSFFSDDEVRRAVDMTTPGDRNTYGAFPRSLYKQVWLCDDPTLCFIGFTRPVVGSIPMIAEWHATMAARHAAGKLRLPPTAAERSATARRERTFWQQYFRFDGAKRPPLVDLSIHLRSLVRDGLLPPYHPLAALWASGGSLRAALYQALLPLHNGFLYLSDGGKRASVLDEQSSMLEVSSAYAALYTLHLHALLFLPALPLSLLYYSLAEPRYIWEWYVGSVSGHLRPTPRWFPPLARLLAVLLHATWLLALLLRCASGRPIWAETVGLSPSHLLAAMMTGVRAAAGAVGQEAACPSS